MDIGTQVDNAHTSILEASAAIKALTARDSGQSVPFKDLGTAPKLPMIARHPLTIGRIGGTGDNRELVARFSVFAEGNGALAKARAIVEQLEQAFTWAAYNSRGVDAIVTNDTRDEPDEDPTGRGLVRSDITFFIWATKPLS